MKSSFVSIAAGAPTVRPARFGIIESIAAVSASLRDRVRRWRLRRGNAAALAHLTARELRDIGLVRLVDEPDHYIRMPDWE